MTKKSVSDQMELFEDGGFKDQGKTKDPVSKNPVPIGSTQEEVRDDIPAQLSEGEFVLPADVVRYHGLEKIMGIRDQAKQGLQKMEDMGQMGNSDQAKLPDNVPFTQMAEGGVVPGVNIQGPTTQLTKQSMFAAPAQTQPQQVAQPVTVQTPQAPVYASSQVQQRSPYTFEQAIGTPFGQQQQSETRVYINDAGEKLYIPFVNGNPIYPIPAGYKPEPVAEKEKEQEQTVTDVRARSATQQDSGDDSVGIKSTAVSELAKAAQRKDSGLGKGLATGLGALINPIAAIGGTIISNLMGKDSAYPTADADKILGAEDDAEAMFDTAYGPEEIAEANSQKAFQTDIRNSSVMFGATPTFKFGNEAGDVDIVSNGVFHKNGLAMNADGSASLTEQGTVSYKSAADFAKHMSASFNTGWHGSTVSTKEYNSLGQKGKERYDAWATELGYKTGGGTKFADPKDDRLTKKGDEIKGGDQKPTTTITTTTPTGITQGSTISKGKTGYPDVSQGSTTSRTSIDPRSVDPTEFAKGAPKSAGDFRIGRDPKLAAGVTTKGDRSKPLTTDRVFKESPLYKSLVRSGLAGTDLEQAEQKQKDQRAKVEADIKSGKADTSIPTYTSPTYSYDYYDSGDGSSDSGADATDPGSSDMGFSTASGGFIQRKNLPKANKKKRSGLASRQ
jgi:hypothetical protein